MNKKAVRHPIKNFFIKKSLQFSIIIKIIGVVLLTSLLTTGIISYVYNQKSQGGSFYYMSNDIMQDLELTSILGLVLPALITAQFVTFIIIFFIGMFSSRKAAVPIYKLEKWALEIARGNLFTHLAFRETKAMRDLTQRCNDLTRKYRHIFSEIDQSISTMKRKRNAHTLGVIDEIIKIETILNTLNFKESGTNSSLHS